VKYNFANILPYSKREEKFERKKMVNQQVAKKTNYSWVDNKPSMNSMPAIPKPMHVNMQQNYQSNSQYGPPSHINIPQNSYQSQQNKNISPMNLNMAATNQYPYNMSVLRMGGMDEDKSHHMRSMMSSTHNVQTQLPPLNRIRMDLKFPMVNSQVNPNDNT